MRAVSKALLILDQVPYQRFVTAISPTWPQPSQVVLNHIPRTTPVGHATISTGREPRDHRIQGRLWYVRTGARWDLVNIDDVPRGNGFPPNIERLLRQQSMAARLRSTAPDGPIVIVAAKGFIPFLLGAWDSDLSVYPTDVKPDRTTGQLSIVVESFSSHGNVVLANEAVALEAHLRLHAHVWAPGSTVTRSTNPTSPRGNQWLELVWTVPAQRRPRGWFRLLQHHASGIDTFYSLMGRLLLDRLRDTSGSEGTLLQSWFSTDWLGHQFTTGSREYGDALDCGLSVAQQLADDGFRVLLTSDHGGRATPAHLVYAPPVFEDQHGNPIHGLPPSGPRDPAPFLSGDHLIAYGRHGHSAPDLFFWDGGAVQPVVLPRPEANASFHRDQVPDWLLLPRQNELVARQSLPPGRPGGGSHGASVDTNTAPATLSSADKFVPVLALGAPPGWQPPTHLAGIAGAFAQL